MEQGTALSRVKQVQEKQFRAVLICARRKKCGLGTAKGQQFTFLLGAGGRQMAWRKDTAIVTRAAGG